MDIKRLFFCIACCVFFSDYLMLSAKNVDEAKISQEASKKLMELTDKICSLLDQGYSAEAIVAKLGGEKEPSLLLQEFVRQAQASNKQGSKEITPNIVVNIMQDKGADTARKQMTALEAGIRDLVRTAAIGNWLSIVKIILIVTAVCLIIAAAYYFLPLLLKLLWRWFKQLFDWLRLPFPGDPGLIRGPISVDEHAADYGQRPGGHELLHGNDMLQQFISQAHEMPAQPFPTNAGPQHPVAGRCHVNLKLFEDLKTSFEFAIKSGLNPNGPYPGVIPLDAPSVGPLDYRPAREILAQQLEDARRRGILR